MENSTSEHLMNGDMDSPPTKQDTFFDDGPAKADHSEKGEEDSATTEGGHKPTENGDVAAQEKAGSPAAEQTTDDGEEEAQEPQESQEPQEPSAGEASSVKDEQADEGFQSTSPVPGSDDVTAPESQPEVAEDQQQQQQTADEDTKHGGDDDAVEARVETPAPEPEVAPVSEGTATEQAEDGNEVPANEQQTTEQEQDGHHTESPAVKDDEDKEADYEDSFSEISDKPTEDESAVAAAVATSPAPDEQPEGTHDKEASEAGQEQVDGEADLGDHPHAVPVSAVSPCPSDNAGDSRAEAGSVVPVEPETTEEPKTDGRSSVEVEDKGENRGEDRTEEPAPEGTEDSRGQGNWKSPEQQDIAAAMLVQKSEKEALEEVTEERDRMRGEYDDAKVKDLQERLAVMARDNEAKDKRIAHLENELKDVTLRLRDTERKLVASEANNGSSEPPKSKTCNIM